MPVRGATTEERKQSRAQVRAGRRLKFFYDAIRAAANGRERLVHACRFAQAVGDELDDAGRTDLAREIAEAAERRNRR